MSKIVKGGEIAPIFESDSEGNNIAEVQRLLARSHAKLVGSDGQEIYLPESLYELLRQVTHVLSQGKGVTIVQSDRYLTTQEAANMLNVSRPYLYTLLDKGEIEFSQVGTHRRIQVEEIIRYKNQRDKQRRKALEELVDYSCELGFYEDENDSSSAKCKEE